MAAASQVCSSEIADALRRARELANANDSAKRPLSSDTETVNGNPTKRINNHDSLDSMAAGNPITALGNSNYNSSVVASMEPVLVENFHVPDNCVGLIIGRGGENITNIQNESGCKIQMSQNYSESMGKQMRGCTLTGTQSAIDKARKQLEQIIDKAGCTLPPVKNGSIGGGPGLMSTSPANTMMNFGIGGMGGGKMITVEVQIPGTKCGLIIGKGGETIKLLQERAGVKMVMIQESNQVTSGYKPLRIIGEPDKIEHAKRMVDEVMNSKDDKPPQFMMNDYGSMGGGTKSGLSMGEVIVPRSAVGVIIGKSGETIRRLTFETGAKIQFKPVSDTNQPERTAYIMGTADQIQRATQLITELVNRAILQDQTTGGNLMNRLGGADSSDISYMHVPANKTGLVIGKGGETIKQICAESGARVELSRDPPPSDTEKVFVIRGTPYQIHHAHHLIKIKVGDVQQGTPVPPFAGANSVSAEPQFSYPGLTQQTSASSGDPNTWAAYYAQYYQASPATPYGTTFATSGTSMAAPAVAAPQQATAVATASSSAPSINPQTGQPDYSSQWAQYYRSLGLHEQAALIEQQARANQTQSGVGQSAQPVASQQAFSATYGQQQQQYSYGQPGGAGGFQYATPQY